MRLPPLRLILVAAVLAAVAGMAVAAVRGRSGRDGGGREIRDLLALGKPIYCGGGRGPYVALTFDDGPTRFTPQLVAVLRANHARATFFEIGALAARNPALVRLERAAGAVGDHTWSHQSLPHLPPEAIDRQIRKAKDAIESRSGTRVVLFRPPFGARDGAVDRAARGLGLLEVLWNVDSGDASEPTTPSSARIYQHLLERVRPGAIVLVHEDVTVPRAVEAMRMFLPVLRRRGLHAVTVPELFDRDPPDRSELANGSGGCNSTWHR